MSFLSGSLSEGWDGCRRCGAPVRRSSSAAAVSFGDMIPVQSAKCSRRGCIECTSHSNKVAMLKLRSISRSPQTGRYRMRKGYHENYIPKYGIVNLVLRPTPSTLSPTTARSHSASWLGIARFPAPMIATIILRGSHDSSSCSLL